MLLGVIGATAFLGGAVGSAAVPALMRLLRHHTAWVAIAGRLVQAGGMAGLAAANGLPLFFGTYLGFYAGNGTTAVAHDALLHRSTDQQRATVLSINSLTASAGSFAG
ncbi:MAG: hypothetical protein KY460_11330, partial [Actinobacteria bacterium]|nr:hypothetical protein [Actinomycetota bacterium]